MFSTPLCHFDALFNEETARVFSEMPTGYQTQSMANTYICSNTRNKAKILKQIYSLEKAHNNVTRFFHFRGSFALFYLVNCKTDISIAGVLLM